MIYRNICISCAEEFNTWNQGHKYCDVCFIEQEEHYYSKEAIKARKLVLKAKKKEAYFDRTCINCGNTFRTNSIDRCSCSRCLKQQEKTLISNPVLYELNDKIQILKAQIGNSSNLIVGTCYDCGEPFIIEKFKWFQDIPVFCSNCHASDYPLEFNNSLKLQIRVRDNHICQKCGNTEVEHFKVVGKTLSVHHIDYNKQNCRENNLISLCITCNSKVNADRGYWQDYFTKKIKL